MSTNRGSKENVEEKPGARYNKSSEVRKAHENHEGERTDREKDEGKNEKRERTLMYSPLGACSRAERGTLWRSRYAWMAERAWVSRT